MIVGTGIQRQRRPGRQARWRRIVRRGGRARLPVGGVTRGTTRRGVTFRGTTRRGTARGTARRGVTWRGTTRRGTACLGTARLGAIWRGAICLGADWRGAAGAARGVAVGAAPRLPCTTCVWASTSASRASSANAPLSRSTPSIAVRILIICLLLLVEPHDRAGRLVPGPQLACLASTTQALARCGGSGLPVSASPHRQTGAGLVSSNGCGPRRQPDGRPSACASRADMRGARQRSCRGA